MLGIVKDGQRVVTRAVRCKNACESPSNRYNIDPKELIRIQLDSREEGLAILGFYHSHPDHPARWSSTDLEEAHWLGCSYVITSVEEGKALETKSYLLSGEREEDKRFVDEQMEVIDDSIGENVTNNV